MRWFPEPCLGIAFLVPLLMTPLAAQARGSLHRHAVPSARFGETRELLVYTPPGYDPEVAYPLLVLLHGAMGRPAEWIDEVHADRLLDELLARSEAVPMILAFPEGHGFPDPAHRASQVFGAPLPQQRRWMDELGRSLDAETLPFLMRTYRLRQDAEGRALAGFSMGGAQALYLGLRRTKSFACIGIFSGAYPLFGEALDEALPSPDPAPRLLWMACGTSDLLLGPNRAVAARLGVPLHEGSGGHTPEACREALAAFLPLLFRSR